MTIPCLEICDESSICAHPLVSVCVATYNQEKYIDQALAHILDQIVDFDYEVIVGDDASSDGTLERCKTWQCKFPSIVRVLYWQENVSRGGIGNTRRICARCRGRFVAFCDGDDYWTDRHKLAKQVQFMRDHPQCVVCFHPALEMWEDGVRANAVYPENYVSLAHGGVTFSSLLKKNPIPMSSVLYRWDDYSANVMRRFPDAMMPGDWKLHLLMAERGTVSCIPAVMSIYRRNASGVWNGNFETAEWFCKFGYRSALFYQWVQTTFGADRRRVLRRIVLASLAVASQEQELLAICRPSRGWVYASGILARIYNLIAHLPLQGFRMGLIRRAKAWSIVEKNKDRVLASLACKRYDFAFSLGSDGSCCSVLRKSGLQYLAFPYDWVAGGSLKWRVNLLHDRFSRFFEQSDLHVASSLKWRKHLRVRNLFTGFSHDFDFPRNRDLSDAYLSVRRKYDRRIARLARLTSASETILAVWVCRPGAFTVADDEAVYAQKVLARTFPHATVDLVVFSLGARRSEKCYIRVLNPHARMIELDYRSYAVAARDWPVDLDALTAFLKSYRVRDYRIFKERLLWCAGILKRVWQQRRLEFWGRVQFRSSQRKWREPALKYKGLLVHSQDLRELCLGSSHAHYGYMADERSYNLADISCDAYYSLCILKCWCRQLPKLRRVVFFYDIFTPGNVIDKSSEAFRRIPWLYYCQMDPFIDECREVTTDGDVYCRRNAAFEAYVKRGFPKVPHGYRGNALRRRPMPNVVLEKRVASHLALSKGDCDKYVNEMIALCKERNIEFVMVVPPLRSDYMKFLPPGFRVKTPTGARAIDFMYDSRFTDGDFTDWDHLAEKGAEKLTNLLHAELGGNLKQI